jgi:hypothetical protein
VLAHDLHSLRRGVNFFSSDPFLTSLAEVYAPGRKFRIGLYRTCGKVFRLISIGGRGPITCWDFLDSVEPVEGIPDGPVKNLRYLPSAVLGTAEIDEVPESIDESAGVFPAPYVDWSRFSGWEAFVRHFLSRRKSLLRDSRQKRLHLERDLGPLVFIEHDTRPAVFDQCIAWKSAQYVRCGLPDMFRRPANVRLFRTLIAKGALLVSSFSAGGRLLAAHFGGLFDNRLYSWIAAYDPDHGRYSPGRLLLEDLLRASRDRGHCEFDFGIGDTGYKWHYATHNRTIGPLGEPPAAQVLVRWVLTSTKRAVSRRPALLARLRRLRWRVRERGLKL